MKRKGFTLIELLAVIVILAIIALIAVPTVLNIIERAREGAAKSSATSYIKAVETYIVTSKLDKKLEQLEAGETYTTSKLNNLVELKGMKPSEGNVVISNKQSVASAKLIINGYVIIYNGEDYIVQGKDNSIEIDSITINKTSANIEIDEELQLIATINPSTATNKTVTWTSSDESIATVDNNGLVIGKSEGNVTITAETVNGKIITSDIKVYANIDLLSEVVSVGDYVAYDAGTWTETVTKPTTINTFGGYTSGQNKASSVSWCYRSNLTATLKGWRVLSVNGTTITLIHAGQPECYYHGQDSSLSITNLNNRANAEYLNSEYADSAHMMTYDEALAITGSTSSTLNDLRCIGSKITSGIYEFCNGDIYWLATATNTNTANLYRVESGGSISGTYNNSFGVRPVIVLKAGIKTTGKGIDVLGQEAWTLVKS